MDSYLGAISVRSFLPSLLNTLFLVFDCCFLVLLLLKVELCLCGYRLIGLLMEDYIIAFSSVVSIILLEFSMYYSLKGWICGKILYKFGFVMEYLDFFIMVIENFAG